MFEEAKPGKPSVLYHLHPALVEKPSDPAEETIVILCRTCYEMLRTKHMPKYSIMKGYDYGYFVGMPQLSILERTLIARHSCFGTVVSFNKWTAGPHRAHHHLSTLSARSSAVERKGLAMARGQDL